MANTSTNTGRVAEYPPTSPRKIIDAIYVAGGSDGASAGDILATLFGLVFIESASPMVKDDNTLIVVVAPSYDGASLLGKAAATAAAADIPAGTYKLRLEGY